MATITFNDGTARTLQNSVPVAVGKRFNGWNVQPVVRAATRFALASGVRHVWEHRRDWRVSFSMQILQPADLDVAQYLIVHLQRGGECTLNTFDAANRVYDAILGEDDAISIVGPDEMYEYRVEATLTIQDLASPPLCVYTGSLMGPPISESPNAWAIPQGGRTVTTLTDYLSNNAVFNVKDFGAVGNGVADDYLPILATIIAAEAAGGGIVYFPKGDYFVSAVLTIDATSTRTIILAGSGLRHTKIYGTTAGMTVLRTGAASPDNSGTTTNAHYYGAIRDLTIMGTSCPTGMGLYMVEPHRWHVSHVNIEGFSGVGGRGLWLQGSTTPGTGVGSASHPHAWKNSFDTVTIADCRRPLVLQNADENGFWNVVANLPVGLSGLPDNSLVAIEIRQARNNSFYRTTCGGERDETDRQAYVAVKFCTPIRADGTIDGDCLGNVFDGLVAEGFGERAVWFESSSVAGCGVRDYNAVYWGTTDAAPGAIFFDGGAQVGNRCFVDAPYHHINYRNSQAQYNDPIALTLPAGASTPVVTGSDTFTVTGNAGGSSITGFNFQETNGSPIKTLILQDGNTDFTHSATFRLRGSVDFTTGKQHDTISFRKVGGTWYEVERVIA